jgi:hypothetical protein
MLSFKRYITERDDVSTKDDLDLEFLRRAERVTSFNISTKDFETLSYKKEIQHLINKHFFPKFDLSKTFSNVDKNRLNKIISELKAEDFRMFSRLHNYNLKGVGPGEATLFFLIDNAHLGGGSSAGVDLVVGSKKYEVKAVQVNRQNVASDFKLGGTVNLSDIMQDMIKLSSESGVSSSRTEIKKTSIEKLRNDPKYRKKFEEIERKYQERAYQYFKDHEVIFINNSKTKKMGDIESIKKVKREDIMIERLTSGTIKPMVQL